MSRPTVYVCNGSDCQKRSRDPLVTELKPVAKVVDTRCQKICEGPVAGLEVEGTVEWFERITGPKARAELVALAGGASVGKRLIKRRNKERRGKLRT